MARRSGFVGLINQIAREQARAQREAIVNHNRQVREQERYRKQVVRNRKQFEKEQKQQYLEDRQQEVNDLNQELEERVSEFETILDRTLHVDDKIDFDSLRIKDNFKSSEPPKNLLTSSRQPQRSEYEEYPPAKKVGFFEKLFHGANGKDERILVHQKNELEKLEKAFELALNGWQIEEKARLNKLAVLKDEDERNRKAYMVKMAQRNAEVDELEKSYNEADIEAIVTYNIMVLERSQYPEDFPQEFRIAYSPESREIVIDYELPLASIIPSEVEYKFIKSKDEVQSRPRKSSEITSIYQDLIASICLRTIHEVLEADQSNHISVVSLSGFVQTVDKTTGRDIKPYLISVRITKDRFFEIDLSRIDKKACLRNLGAQVSPQPEECIPVKPIVDFNMVDRRFVEGTDVLSELDARPNLMDLNPFEFENLVGNLFTQMGLETKQTQTSRDGGVDAIAYDSRPILGGKIVIQAKRYKNTVGVGAVRDLFGTMMNEGASKGILVTTSGYGKDAFEFASNKPIEMINGGQLLYLLEHHANIRARIIIPIE